MALFLLNKYFIDPVQPITEPTYFITELITEEEIVTPKADTRIFSDIFKIQNKEKINISASNDNVMS